MGSLRPQISGSVGVAFRCAVWSARLPRALSIAWDSKRRTSTLKKGCVASRKKQRTVQSAQGRRPNCRRPRCRGSRGCFYAQFSMAFRHRIVTGYATNGVTTATAPRLLRIEFCAACAARDPLGIRFRRPLAGQNAHRI